jgi:hypothetical protein
VLLPTITSDLSATNSATCIARFLVTIQGGSPVR